MADPATIVGLVAASLTIVVRAATIGKDLHTLISRYRTTDSKVKQLSVHVAAVRIAARSLSSWLEGDTIGSEEVEDVKHELLEVLTACCSLLEDLRSHVAEALKGAENVGFKGAVHYIWDEDVIKDTTETLHHQETVLILMLHALEHLSRKEQHAKLQEPEILQTLTRAKRPTSSIFGLRGEACSSICFSFETETSEKMDAVFTFDKEVMSSTAYRNAFTSLIRRNLPRRPSISLDQGLAAIVPNSQEIFTDLVAKPDNVSRALAYAQHGSQSTNGVTKTLSNQEPQDTTTTPNPTDESSLHGQNDNFIENSTNSAPLPWQETLDTVRTSRLPVFCRALYDFHEDVPTSLTLRKNDILQVITMLDNGWCHGILNNVRGWFPGNYCVLLRTHSPGQKSVMDTLLEEDEEYYASVSTAEEET